MMPEYTPTAIEVLCRYQEWAGGSSSDESRRAEFDRFLAARDAQVLRAAALSGDFGATAQSALLRRAERIAGARK